MITDTDRIVLESHKYDWQKIFLVPVDNLEHN